MPQQTLWTAFVRGFGAVALAFAGAAFTNYMVLDATILPDGDVWKGTVLAGVGAALGAMGWRGGAEGAWDAWRSSRNLQTPADVGYDKTAGEAPK